MGTGPTGAGSAMAHHLEHIRFIQLHPRKGSGGDGFGVEVLVCFFFYLTFL